jgi:CRP-like cAMP-binding protein/polyferredoxin
MKDKVSRGIRIRLFAYPAITGWLFIILSPGGKEVEMNVPPPMEKQTTSPTLDQQIMDYLRREGEVVSHTDGASIIRRGDSGKAFYVMLSGTVEVRLVGDDGQQLPLNRLGEGAFFGEMSILTGEPVSADVVAIGTVTLLVYPAKLFSTAMAECEPLRDHIMASLASNLRGSNRDLWNFYQRAEALNVILDTGKHKGPIVAHSRKMQKVTEEIADLPQHQEPILIAGKPGTGKVFAAAKIHQGGARPEAPFIVVDCQTLAEGEAREFLFGSSDFLGEEDDSSRFDSLHQYGALDLANQGTLVLRHIDALAFPVQEDLARYLERLRDNTLSYPRVRVIATTREDLTVLVGKGRFHAALAGQLSVSVITMPSLRDRRKDILPLARLFLEERDGDRQPRISTEAEHVLVSRRYTYGNVAELREAAELAAIFADGREILAEYIFTGPKEGGTLLEYDLGQIPLVRWLVGDRVLGVLRWTVFGFFSVIILLSLTTADTKLSHFVNSLIWGLWWPVLIIVFLFVGRLWCTVCPLATAGGFACRRMNLERPPPGWLKKYSGWLIPLGFLSILWVEHTFSMTRNPPATGTLLLFLMTMAVVFAVVYQRETWCRYLCPLGNLGAIYSLLATVSVRANPDVCATWCSTHECHKGSATQAACPVFHHPLYARDVHVCKLCFNCLKSCPHGSVKLYLRPPLLRIWHQVDLGGALSRFALVVLFISPLILASQSTSWISSTTGFTVSAVLAVGLAILSRSFLPRLLSRDPDLDPAVSSRVAFALLILAWGPVTAYHLANSPALTSLKLSAAAGSFWDALFPGGEISLLCLVQLGVILVSAVLMAITLWGIRARFVSEQVPLSPWGWRILQSLCALYLVVTLALILHGSVAV